MKLTKSLCIPHDFNTVLTVLISKPTKNYTVYGKKISRKCRKTVISEELSSPISLYNKIVIFSNLSHEYNFSLLFYENKCVVVLYSKICSTTVIYDTNVIGLAAA